MQNFFSLQFDHTVHTTEKTVSDLRHQETILLLSSPTHKPHTHILLKILRNYQ